MINLTILIHGLLGSYQDIEEGDRPVFPALETLLSRAGRQRIPGCSFYRSLCSSFNLNAPHDSDLPIASLSRLVDSAERPEGIWVRADPVHMTAGRDGLVMSDPSALSLSQHDAIILAASIEDLFMEEKWRFEVPLSKRWYLNLPIEPAIKTSELDCVAGRHIQPFLPKGEDRKKWLRLSNEIQMLLHDCEINKEREKRGELTVNSLWFWGIGILPEILPRQWTRIYSDDTVAQGLAMLSGTRFYELPFSTSEIINSDNPAGEILMASSGKLSGLPGNYSLWLEAVKDMEESWFAPLIDALRQDVLGRITIITDGYRFKFNKRSFLKFWCGKKSVIDYR